MKKAIGGFTMIEVLVVICIIGVLASIGIASYRTVQASARNSQRAVKITAIADALEKYYLKNGAYPSCRLMSEANALITSNTLVGLDSSALVMPNNNSSSIIEYCNDISVLAGDNIAYLGNGTLDCLLNNYCTGWVLKYKDEVSGNIISTSSRHGTGGTASNTGLTNITVAWPGNNKTSCKSWSVPSGKSIKEFYVSHSTEATYDFFNIIVNGNQIYHGSGNINNQKIDVSSQEALNISACIVADENTKAGFGGIVSSITLQDYTTPTQYLLTGQELYVAWPGNSANVCKTWTATGKTVKAFYVTQSTESGWDYFKVSVDGVQKYYTSGINTEYKVSITPTSNPTISACMITDSDTQVGFGGRVTKIDIQ